VSVDPATDTIYTGNPDLPEADVLNGATCNPQDTSGCAPVAKMPEQRIRRTSSRLRPTRKDTYPAADRPRVQ
jgi:hypothetical protein